MNFNHELIQLFCPDRSVLNYQLGQILSDTDALWFAVQLAFRGYGHTEPNPAVGCVILDAQNRLLGLGWHRRAGLAHAEIEALSFCAGEAELARTSDGSSWDLSVFSSEQLRGAKVFVTLEPCAHHGRTPSCAKTLSQLPISELTCILKDPNPLVAGRGLLILSEAGIQTKCLELDSAADNLALLDSARAVSEFFLTNYTKVRPFVSLKVATSLDGMMGLKSGDSQWITGEDARSFARYLRGAHSACLVGKNTILFDNPRLDRRDTEFAASSRKLIVMDSKGEILKAKTAQIFQTFNPQDLIFVVDSDFSATATENYTVIKISQKISPDEYWKQLLAELKALGLGSIWVEGGAQVFSSLLESGFVDRVWQFQAPKLIGAKHGRPWTQDWGVSEMKNAAQSTSVHRRLISPDLLTTILLSSN